MSTFVCEGPMVRSPVPVSGVKPWLGDWIVVESASMLDSRRERDAIVHGVVVFASSLPSVWILMGRREPSKTTLISEILIGAAEGWPEEDITSWACKGSPTFPSALSNTRVAVTAQNRSKPSPRPNFERQTKLTTGRNVFCTENDRRFRFLQWKLFKAFVDVIAPRRPVFKR